MYSKIETNPIEFIDFFIRQKGIQSLQNYLK